MAKQVKKLSAKQIGKSIHLFIDGKKLTKKIEDEKEAKSIANKIELYNKKPTEVLLEKIKEIFTPPAKVEKAKKEEIKKTTKKTLKKAIKKETKKKSTKQVSEEIKKDINGEDLIQQVRNAHATGEVTDDHIKSLKDLITKHEEKKEAEKPKEEAKKEEQRSSSNYSSNRKEY